MVKSGKHNGPYPKKIDYDALDKLCSIQCTGEECAAFLEMDYDTLNNRLKEDGNGGFSDYYQQKAATGKISLRRKQYSKAVNEGNPTMLIWLGKQWLGQKDGIEPEGNKAQPMAIHFTVESARKDADT